MRSQEAGMREQKNEKRKGKENIRLHYHKGGLDSARTTEKRNKGLFEVSESSPKGQEMEAESFPKRPRGGSISPTASHHLWLRIAPRDRKSCYLQSELS